MRRTDHGIDLEPIMISLKGASQRQNAARNTHVLRCTLRFFAAFFLALHPLIEIVNRFLGAKRVDFSGADEIVFRQSVYRMCAEFDAAVVVAYFQIRMMVFAVGDVRYGIYEAHGAIEIFEGIFATNCLAVIIQLPSQRQLLQVVTRSFGI